MRVFAATACLLGLAGATTASENGLEIPKPRPVTKYDGHSNNATIEIQWSTGADCTSKSRKDSVQSGSCCYDCFGFWAARFTASDTAEHVTFTEFGKFDFNCTGEKVSSRSLAVDTCYTHFTPQGVGAVFTVDDRD